MVGILTHQPSQPAAFYVILRPHYRAMFTFVRVIIFLAIAQAIIFLGHWIVYKTIVSFLNINRPETLLRVRLVFIVLSLLFLAASLLVNQWSSPLIDWFYRVSAFWMGTLHLLVLASLAYWIISAASSYANIVLPTLALGIVLYTAAVAVSIYGTWRSFNPRLTRYEVEIPELPGAWKNRTAVLVSDIHLGNVRGYGSAAKLADRINELKPDAVFIPGDYFDGPVADYQKLAAPLSTIKAPFGVFFSSGNHEEFQESTRYWKAIGLANVHVLNNRVENIEGLQIAGTTYAGSNTDAELTQTLTSKISFDRSRPLILLKHAPFATETAAKNGVTLMLSGHTHRGQMWPFSLITQLLFGDAAYGLYKRENMTGITTSGYGTWGPPQRLGTDAEIVVIHFR